MTGLKELTVLAGEIAAAEAGERDAAAYAQAQRANTRAAYQSYLAHCEPVCGHRQDTKAALQQLLAAPAPPTTGYSGTHWPMAARGRKW